MPPKTNPKQKISEKKIFKQQKQPLFITSSKLAKSNPNKVGLMVLFDLLFLVSFFYVLPALIGNFAQTLVLPQTYTGLYILIIFKLIYYLIVLFAYSFFKYSILDFIKSLYESTETSFKRLGQFYSLNIIIAGIFFAIMFLFGYILQSVNESYRPFVFIFLATPYALFLYVIVNISHSFFYQGAQIIEAIKKSFQITFTKIRLYRETILVLILFALALWILFLGAGYLISLIGSRNYSLYLSAYAYFKNISLIIFDVVFYFVILINRVSFYSLIKEVK